MKRNWMTAAVALGMAAVLLIGCGGKDDQKEPSGTNSIPAAENQTNSTGAGSYSVTIKGTKVAPGMDQESVTAALGEADSTFEAPSCAGEGTDYTLTYGSFEIQTVPNADGVNEVSAILIKDDLASTDEGVSLGGSLEDIVAAYGEGYTENGSAYTYSDGKVQLQFVMDGEEIVSIEYSVVE